MTTFSLLLFLLFIKHAIADLALQGRLAKPKYGDKKNPASPVLTKDYMEIDKKSKTYGKM